MAKPPVPQLSGRRVAPLVATRSLNLDNAGRGLDRTTLGSTTGQGSTSKGEDLKAYIARTKEERAAAARLKRELVARRQVSIVRQLERVETQRRSALREGVRAASVVRPPWNNTFATRAAESRAAENRAAERSAPRTRPQAAAAPAPRKLLSPRRDDSLHSVDALGAMQRSQEDSIVDYARGASL
jgi:hypothetical protein